MAKYSIGDELRIKKREDIENTLGIRFVPDMKYLCGKDFTVASVSSYHTSSGNRVTVYRSEEDYERYSDGDRHYWLITDDMIEPRETEPSIDISVDEFLNILKE